MGGMRRTCIMPCGKKIADSPERIQKKIDIHRKVCPTCKTKDRFVSNDHRFEKDLNATNLRGGTSYTKQNPMTLSTKGIGMASHFDIIGSENGNLMEALRQQVAGEKPTPPSDGRTNKQKKKTIMKAKKKQKDKFKSCLSELEEGADWIKVRDAMGCEEFKDPRPSEPIYKPDDFIVVEKLLSEGEQLNNAIGDCVRSAIYFMKRDEWAGYKDRLKIMTMTAPSHYESSGRVAGYFGEPCNVHHALIDEKMGKVYEFSNNRLQSYGFEEYLCAIYPKPTSIRVGNTLSELRKKAQDYSGVSDEQMSDGITYMFLELTHSKMCYKAGDNKDFYKIAKNREYKDRSYKRCKETYEMMVTASKIGRMNDETFWDEFVDLWMEDGRVLF